MALLSPLQPPLKGVEPCDVKGRLGSAVHEIGYWLALSTSYASLFLMYMQFQEPAPVKAPEKPSKKGGTKETDKKGKNVEVAQETNLDPVAEKLRQQRFVSMSYYLVRLV